jgi:hypothetical protein
MQAASHASSLTCKQSSVVLQSQTQAAAIFHSVAIFDSPASVHIYGNEAKQPHMNGCAAAGSQKQQAMAIFHSPAGAQWLNNL